MIGDFGIFFIGIIILLLSSDTLLRSATSLSIKLRLSPLVIGTTIVALGTTLPELSISLTAAFSGDHGLAMGNVTGSVVANSLLVLGAGALFGNIRIGTTKTQRTTSVLLFVVLLFAFLDVLLDPPFFAGVMMLTIGILFTLLEYHYGMVGRKKEDVHTIRTHALKPGTKVNPLITLFSFGGVIIGGLLIVGAVERIALLADVSTAFLGLSLTAIATSMPELLISVMSARQGEEKLTIGNMIGANMYNIVFIGALAMIITKSTALILAERISVIAAALIFTAVIMTYKGRTIPKSVGALLIMMYFVFLWAVQFGA